MRTFWQLFSVFDDLDHAELFRIFISAGQKLVSYRPIMSEGSKRAKSRRKTKIIATATQKNCATLPGGALHSMQSPSWLSMPHAIAFAAMSHPAYRLRSHTAPGAIASLHASQPYRARIARLLVISQSHHTQPEPLRRLIGASRMFTSHKTVKGFSELNPLIPGQRTKKHYSILPLQ